LGSVAPIQRWRLAMLIPAGSRSSGFDIGHDERYRIRVLRDPSTSF